MVSGSRTGRTTALAALLALAGGCGSSSNSEVNPDGAAGTTGTGGTARHGRHGRGRVPAAHVVRRSVAPDRQRHLESGARVRGRERPGARVGQGGVHRQRQHAERNAPGLRDRAAADDAERARGRRHDPDRGPERRVGRPQHGALPGRRDAERLECRQHAELQLRGAGRVHHGQPHHRGLAGLLHRHHDDERRGGRHARGADGSPAERYRLHAAAHLARAGHAR